ncbi:MAG: zinc-binding alcohol dehydrogenase [Syntrophobacteraceae bacterium]
MLGIIALHGIRCAGLTFGAPVAVIGLGLLGLITVQILKAYGCRAFGLDLDSRKVELAATLGADFASTNESELKSRVKQETGGHGVDAALITAATQSAGPVNLAVDLAMFRGRIVLVGAADVHPQRNEMWHKEVEIIVSKAGGPGTFDPFYENNGIDYPAGYVRWTENRNLQEFIRLLSDGKLDVTSLITHRFSIEEAPAAYEQFLKGSLKDCVGILLEYPKALTQNGSGVIDHRQRIRVLKQPGLAAQSSVDAVQIGVIGAGFSERHSSCLPFARLEARASRPFLPHPAQIFTIPQGSTDLKRAPRIIARYYQMTA